MLKQNFVLSSHNSVKPLKLIITAFRSSPSCAHSRSDFNPLGLPILSRGYVCVIHSSIGLDRKRRNSLGPNKSFVSLVTSNPEPRHSTLMHQPRSSSHAHPDPLKLHCHLTPTLPITDQLDSPGMWQ